MFSLYSRIECIKADDNQSHTREEQVKSLPVAFLSPLLSSSFQL